MLVCIWEGRTEEKELSRINKMLYKKKKCEAIQKY